VTVTTNRPSLHSGGGAYPLEGALVRLPADADALRALPPAPPGDVVSVSLSSLAAAEAAADLLTGLGYRVVGVAPSAGPGAVADFFVPQPVLERHPRWWRSLADRADRTFSLAAGPVQIALADVLRLHRSGQALT
jgi:hypothetical protein